MSTKIPARTLKRKDLRQKVYEKLPHIPREQADKITEEVFEIIAEALAESDVVKLREFGVFRVHNKKERIGRNPMTGIEAVITARRSVRFVPSPVLMSKVNGKEKDYFDVDED